MFLLLARRIKSEACQSFNIKPFWKKSAASIFGSNPARLIALPARRHRDSGGAGINAPPVYGFGGVVDTWLLLPVGLTGTIESSRVRTYMPIAANIKATINHARQSLWSFLRLNFSSYIANSFPKPESLW